jgi:hypothetical protein
LVILNNNNERSKWFCIDVEWGKAFESKQQKCDADFGGRFDIIAILKERPHKAALIELKYGSRAIRGRSGIQKHIEDFHKYQRKGCFNKQEIIDVIKSYEMLGVNVPDELKNLETKDITGYEFYVITLDNNAETKRHNSPKQIMAACLFKEKRWGCGTLFIKEERWRFTKELCEEKFGDVTDKNNGLQVSFLFSKQTLDNLNINDIIDGAYDDREVPR